jgi:menaquinone reductase, multiheme cytochrome c subunit
MASIPSNPEVESSRPESDTSKPRWNLPRWFNYLLPLLIVSALGAATFVPVFIYTGFSPMATDVGYGPDQPIKYSHALHVGQLGIDCRNCHTTVDNAAFAAVPPAQTCMSCHTAIKKNNPDGTPNANLAPLYSAWETGKPVEWVKIHDLPDYAYFNHSAHVNKGVGCNTCHGRIDQMEVVYQAKPMNMAWCLECHREPEKFLRPKEQVTNLAYTPKAEAGESIEEAQLRIGRQLKEQYKIKDHNYMIACSTCHR